MNAFAPTPAAAHAAALLTAQATLTRAMADEDATDRADRHMIRAAERFESLAHHLGTGATVSAEYAAEELKGADAAMAKAGPRALPPVAAQVLAALNA